MDKGQQPSSQPDDALDEVAQALESVLMRGTASVLSPRIREHGRLKQLLEQMQSMQQFTLRLAQGDLGVGLHTRGVWAGSLKELQANLRHLTWQTQQVAQGDFSQRVDFMGDFAAAFNSMVTSLASMRAQVQQQIVERDRLIAELDAFAHTVAHDLKNPLNVIAGYASLIAGEVDNLPPEAAPEFALKIESTALAMDRTLEELMLLSGVRKREVQLQPVDMSRVVTRALAQVTPLIASTAAEVHVAKEWPIVLGYGPWLEEVWANYLSNALKYGGQPPLIEAGYTRGDPVWPPHSQAPQLSVPSPNPMPGASEASRITFWVRDHGPGIAPQNQARLFTPFTRVGDPQVSGHGLGLSIVQRIMDKLGGEAGVRSDGVPGEGSLFYFTLAECGA